MAIIRNIRENKRLWARRWPRAITAGLVLGLFPGSPTQAADPFEAAFGAQAPLVARSVEIFLRTPERADPSPGPLAMRCLAAAELVPYVGPPALKIVRHAADTLSAMASDATLGAGWSFGLNDKDDKECGGPGTLDAFRDGSCNPRGTRYTFQTSLALTCVAKAYTLTKDQAYRETARAVVDGSWPFGGNPGTCADCFYYWYSYHSNDAGRYVRNVNTLMAMGLAAVQEGGGERRIRDRLAQIAKAEHEEVAAGNVGYLGVPDPRFQANPRRESANTENHLPYVAIGLHAAGSAIGNARAIEDAKSIMAAWMDCPRGSCAKRGCSRWAGDVANCVTASMAAAPCAFRKLGKKYADACQTFLERSNRLSPTQLWLVLNGARP